MIAILCHCKDQKQIDIACFFFAQHAGCCLMSALCENSRISCTFVFFIFFFSHLPLLSPRLQASPSQCGMEISAGELWFGQGCSRVIRGQYLLRTLMLLLHLHQRLCGTDYTLQTPVFEKQGLFFIILFDLISFNRPQPLTVHQQIWIIDNDSGGTIAD